MVQIQTCSLSISIHALREEGDAAACWQQSGWTDFYPRPPRGGRPILPSPARGEVEISIHALREEGDSPFLARRSTSEYFYPRPPRGGRLVAIRSDNGILNFYPRPPRGGRLSSNLLALPRNLFLSTPSARRATGRCPDRPYRTGISIHALREEGDTYFYSTSTRNVKFLSTPSARRATVQADSLRHPGAISIHALREEGDTIPCLTRCR